MAGVAVIGAIRINTSQLAPQWAEQGRQYLCIMDISKRHFCIHDIVSGRVYRQMQLAPHSPFFSTVFSDLPLAFTNTFSPVESMTKSVMRPLAGCR